MIDNELQVVTSVTVDIRADMIKSAIHTVNMYELKDDEADLEYDEVIRNAKLLRYLGRECLNVLPYSSEVVNASEDEYYEAWFKYDIFCDFRQHIE